MIDTKIIFLAQLQAKLWPFKDLGVPPGGQISNPRKIQNTRRRAKKFGIFAYLHLGLLYTKNEKNLFFFWFYSFVDLCWNDPQYLSERDPPFKLSLAQLRSD